MVHTGHCLSKVKIKDYNNIIDGRNFLINQQKMIREHMRTLDKLLQVSDMTSQPAAYLIINKKKATSSSRLI